MASLRILLDGLRASGHVVAATDLARLAKELQDGVRHVATVLWTGQPSGPPGWVAREVREITELEYVARPGGGSVELRFDLRSHRPPPTFGPLTARYGPPPPDLGAQALFVLIDGINQIVFGVENRLPLGFDRRTVRALGRLGGIFQSSASQMRLEVIADSQTRSAVLDGQAAADIRRLARGPVTGAAKVAGLLSVDPRGEAGELTTPSGERIALSVAPEQGRELAGLTELAVEVTGEGLYRARTEVPDEISVERVVRIDPLAIEREREELYDRSLARRAVEDREDALQQMEPSPRSQVWKSDSEFDDFVREFAKRRRRD